MNPGCHIVTCFAFHDSDFPFYGSCRILCFQQEDLCAADEEDRLRFYQIDNRYYRDDFGLFENLP